MIVGGNNNNIQYLMPVQDIMLYFVIYMKWQKVKENGFDNDTNKVVVVMISELK